MDDTFYTWNLQMDRKNIYSLKKNGMALLTIKRIGNGILQKWIFQYCNNEFERITTKLSSKFGVIPDDHNPPTFYQIVIIEHVTIKKLELFVTELGLELIQVQQPVLI